MTLYSAMITLLLVMDPLGNIPLFLTLLRNVPPKKRQYIILREAVIALVILLFFLFFGQYILEGMHISEPALAISGGIILFLIAIRMIFPHHNEDNQREPAEPFIVPLAVPLIAGPSTMTMVMLLATQAPYDMSRWCIALLAAWLITTIALVFADSLRKVLGERGLLACERLMGMILTTMAVQMFLTGFEQFLHA
jgi:multiple antibiotic resistance protein